jgi:hypothetical protein
MKRAFASMSIVLLAASLSAQTVRQVNDRRTKGSFSQLTITIELPKVKAGDVAASRVLVAAAVDDTGRNLVDASEPEPRFESRGRMAALDAELAARPATVLVTLKSPDRKATRVKEVRGNVELYMPGRDPNSVAEIPKFLSLSGKPMANRALSANGVEITLLTPAQLDAERKRLGEAKRKAAKESGYDAADIESVVTEYMKSLFATEEGEVLLRIKDPSKRIQEISYVDAGGEAKHVSMRDASGLTLLSTWEGKPQPDWKLRVSMTTAKNVVRQPFALTDVALP